jgi:hypothetical protein
MTLFENASLPPTDTSTPALIMTLLLSRKLLLKIYKDTNNDSFPINFISFSTVDVPHDLNITKLHGLFGSKLMSS